MVKSRRRVHIIDCDVDPFVPKGWMIKKHRKGGQYAFDLSRIVFDLMGEGRGHCRRVFLNANVLDYLLAHQRLIPEEWGDQKTFFWDTIYRDSNGSPCVRYLNWNEYDGWWWHYGWLMSHDDGPTVTNFVLFAS